MQSHWTKRSAAITRTPNIFWSYATSKRMISACTIVERRIHWALIVPPLNWRDDRCHRFSRNHRSCPPSWHTISFGRRKVNRRYSNTNWNSDKCHPAILPRWIETIRLIGMSSSYQLMCPKVRKSFPWITRSKSLKSFSLLSGPIHTIGYTLRGLMPASVYEVNVISRNRFGWSDNSRTIRFATSGESMEFLLN